MAPNARNSLQIIVSTISNVQLSGWIFLLLSTNNLAVLGFLDNPSPYRAKFSFDTRSTDEVRYYLFKAWGQNSLPLGNSCCAYTTATCYMRTFVAKREPYARSGLPTIKMARQLGEDLLLRANNFFTLDEDYTVNSLKRSKHLKDIFWTL